MCPPRDLAAGKVWTRAQRSLGNLSSRDASVRSLSPGNLLEYRGDGDDMVGAAGWGGAVGTGTVRSKVCTACTRGIPGHGYPSGFLRGRLASISAQNWGCPWKRVVMKDSSRGPHPQNVAEQPLSSPQGGRGKDCTGHPTQT